MNKITVFGNYPLFLNASADGYKCQFVDTSEGEPFTALSIRSKADIIAMDEVISYFAAKGRVLIVCSHLKSRCDEGFINTRRNGFHSLSARQTRFLIAFMRNSLPKGVCLDLGISRSSYYRLVDELLSELSLRDVRQLRMWALYHLCI